MRRAVTLTIIIFASFVMAAAVTPPDPFSYCIAATLILCVAIPSYIVGLRHGRMAAGTQDNTETQNAANTE